jgi:hypothetical protein
MGDLAPEGRTAEGNRAAIWVQQKGLPIARTVVGPLEARRGSAWNPLAKATRGTTIVSKAHLINPFEKTI